MIDDLIKNHYEIQDKTSSENMAELFEKMTGIHDKRKLFLLGYVIRNIVGYLFCYKREKYCRVILYFEHEDLGAQCKTIEYGSPTSFTPDTIVSFDNNKMIKLYHSKRLGKVEKKVVHVPIQDICPLRGGNNPLGNNCTLLCGYDHICGFKTGDLTLEGEEYKAEIIFDDEAKGQHTI